MAPRAGRDRSRHRGRIEGGDGRGSPPIDASVAGPFVPPNAAEPGHSSLAMPADALASGSEQHRRAAMAGNDHHVASESSSAAAEGDESSTGADGECEESEEEDPEVVVVRCAAGTADGECGTELSSRATKVFLCADLSSTLCSTDIPSDAVREGLAAEISTCNCRARRVHCLACESEVGYHVVAPCAPCSDADNNGHYWLFRHTAVRTSPRGMRWSELPYNGAPSGASLSGFDAPAAGRDAAACCVCLASPVWRATRVASCGHVFCFGCISREVDARGRCPIDRGSVTRDMLQPVAAADI